MIRFTAGPNDGDNRADAAAASTDEPFQWPAVSTGRTARQGDSAASSDEGMAMSQQRIVADWDSDADSDDVDYEGKKHDQMNLISCPLIITSVKT